MKKLLLVSILLCGVFISLAGGAQKDYDLCRALYQINPNIEEHPLHEGDCFFISQSYYRPAVQPAQPVYEPQRSQDISYYLPPPADTANWYLSLQDKFAFTLMGFVPCNDDRYLHDGTSFGLRYTRQSQDAPIGFTLAVNTLQGIRDIPPHEPNEAYPYPDVVMTESYSVATEVVAGVTFSQKVFWEELRVYGDILLTNSWYDSIFQSDDNAYVFGTEFGGGVELAFRTGLFLRAGSFYRLPIITNSTYEVRGSDSWGLLGSIGIAW